MKILSDNQIISSLSVYYPSLDKAYPRYPTLWDLTFLSLGFEHIIVPAIHLQEFSRSRVILPLLKQLFQSGIAVCSIRSNQNSIHDYFLDKINEKKELIRIFDETVKIYEPHINVGFSRNAESLIAAFKHAVLTGLTDETRYNIETYFPHQLLREDLDYMLQSKEWRNIKYEVELAKNRAYFQAGANGNFSYLYDPAKVCPQNRTTNRVEVVKSFIEYLFFSLGIDFNNFIKLPPEILISICQSSSCIRFRNNLMKTLKLIEIDYTFKADISSAKSHKRSKYRNLGYWLASLCVGTIGLIDLQAGIISILADCIAFPAVKKIIEYIENLNDPIECFKLKLENSYYKEILKLSY